MSADLCPCGDPRGFDACCAPIHRGDTPAPTAVALMRARYSAYAKGAVDFILDSIHPEHREGHEREAIARWSKESEWLGLTVLDTEAGEADDDEGIVEFVARYRNERLEPISHHERARFARVDGAWYFVDGKGVEAGTVVRDTPKVGRNDPCPCGSGRKYKKCCAVTAA